MAVFLAQVAARTGDEEALTLARAAARRLLALVQADEVTPSGPGLWDGAGGVLWALAHLAVDLRDSVLGEAGRALARSRATRVEGVSADLHGGLAGWAAGLAATLRVTPDDALRSHADLCVLRLREAAAAPTPGLLHGAAGRALAIAHLEGAAEPAARAEPPDDASWATGAAGLRVVNRVQDPRAAIPSPRPGPPADHSPAGGHLGVALAFGDHALAGALLEEVERDGLRCSGPGGVEVPGLLTGLAGAGWAWLALGAPASITKPDTLLALMPPRP